MPLSDSAVGFVVHEDKSSPAIKVFAGAKRSATTDYAMHQHVGQNFELNFELNFVVCLVVTPGDLEGRYNIAE